MNKTGIGKWKLFPVLTRFNLSLAVAFSALAGFVLYSRSINLKAIIVFLGVLLLSGGASALNQYHEKDRDSLMERTKNRPLPSGQMKPGSALIISLVLGAAGFLILFPVSPNAAYLGAINWIWYNEIYTPLKRKTRFALWAGALTGAIPPVMGWIAAGGFPLNPGILAVALFMYLWQIPHFLLLLLKYSKDYEQAGFAVFSTHSPRVLFFWLILTAASTVLFPFFHLISGLIFIAALGALNLLLILIIFRFLFFSGKTLRYNFLFRTIYLYQILVIGILITGLFQK